MLNLSFHLAHMTKFWSAYYFRDLVRDKTEFQSEWLAQGHMVRAKTMIKAVFPKAVFLFIILYYSQVILVKLIYCS